MLKPKWLDNVIQAAMGTSSPTAIAQAIATSPQFVDAIRRGLENKPQPGIMGPSHAQMIARELQEALAAD
jgi:hypothetical protein